MLTIFGFAAVAVMFLAYWLESRSRWMVLVFALGCAATALYSVLLAAYPITVVESLWVLVALQRFRRRHQKEREAASR